MTIKTSTTALFLLAVGWIGQGAGWDHPTARADEPAKVKPPGKDKVQVPAPLRSGPPVGAENNRRGFRPEFVAGPSTGKKLCPV